MQDDDDIPQTVAGSFEAKETTRLYRLTPTARDLAQPARQSAVVAAETEEEARAFAAANDPFGMDWKDRDLFDCDYLDTGQRHVVGDVTFKSVAPAPPVTQQAARKKQPQ